MATRGKDGSVEIQVTGDTSPLEASVAAAKAKVEAEGSTGKVGAASTQAAADVAKVGVAATASTEALKQMGQEAEKAVGQSSPLQSGLVGVQRALADSVGKAQALLGQLLLVAGVATGMFSLGRAIREYVTAELQTGTEKAEKFKESLDFTDPKKTLEKYEAQLAEVNAQLEEALQTQEASKAVEQARGGSMGSVAQVLANGYATATERVKKLQEEQTKLLKDSQITRDFINDQERDKADARANAEITRYRTVLNARIDATNEYNARVDKALEDETTARERQIEDFRKSMQDLGDEMTKQAKRSQEAWVDSLRAIREESNRAFNTDQAATMVQLAGNLRTTATIATANMNRIVVGGDD
jgi:hypothetical protein